MGPRFVLSSSSVVDNKIMHEIQRGNCQFSVLSQSTIILFYWNCTPPPPREDFFVLLSNSTEFQNFHGKLNSFSYHYHSIALIRHLLPRRRQSAKNHIYLRCPSYFFMNSFLLSKISLQFSCSLIIHDELITTAFRDLIFSL